MPSTVLRRAWEKLFHRDVAAGMLDREHSIWAIRFFIGREPSGEAEIQLHRKHPDLASMRKAFALTHEFKEFLRSIADPTPYHAPLFLLEPPRSPAIPTRFEPPSLASPVSQLCTQSQLAEPAYQHWCQKLQVLPIVHRKHWEFAYLLAVLDTAGAIVPGHKALGFGVGTEHAPSYLASCGLRVVATDAPPEVVVGQGWDLTDQHAQGLSQLYYGNVVSKDDFDERVSYRSVDMTDIPADLRDFDICWSSCCFEHLGTLQRGLDFVINAMDTLKPGGIAVHTTEFNLTSDDDTIEVRELSVYRKRDIEKLASHLIDAGHEVWPLNLHPGTGNLDGYIDPPPYVLEPHLKLSIQQYTCTSIGLVIRKRLSD